MSDLLKLSTPDLLELAAALRGHRLAAPFTAIAVQRFVPSNLAIAIANELQTLNAVGNGPGQIALAIEFVARDRRNRETIEEVIDLVTTGPEAQGVANRDTAVVVRELFANAAESVLVAGYAVYQGQPVFQALADRMESCKSLKVRMFLEVQRSGSDSSALSEIVRRFADRFRQQQWPPNRPLPEVWYDPRSLELGGDKKSSMHAKCVVVDRQHVFISSANFTEAAQKRNIEVGLLVQSRPLAERLTYFFDAMIAESALRSVF